MSHSKDERHSYGAMSIVILTISIVVGSGIFFKNQELYNTNQSALITIAAWFVVSGLVITILYAFIEISSSTAKTNETGSLSTWGAKFFNNKVGRVIGYYFIFINLPVNVALLSIYSSDLFFQLISEFNAFGGNAQLEFWIRTIFTTVMALAILIPIGILNSNSNKQSQAIQRVGFFFKLTPIIFVISIAVVAIFSAGFQNTISASGQQFGGVFDPHSLKNSNTFDGTQSFLSILTLLVISLPPVMFAFDGFIYTANLQAETKSKKSFTTGLIIGIAIIIFLYIFESIAIFAIGSGDYSLFAVIDNAFPNAPWVATLFNIMLILSIISGMSGLFSASIRATSSLSTDNLVKDQKMKWIKRNKHQVPKNAGYSFLLISMIWVITLRMFDTFSSIDQMYWHPVATISYMSMSGFTGNSAVVIAFSFYAIIIFGGILNRRVKKVETDQLKLFKTIAFIAVIGAFFISVFSIVQLFIGDFNSLSDWFKIVIVVIYPIIIVIAYLYNDKRLKHLDEEFIIRKNYEIERFFD